MSPVNAAGQDTAEQLMQRLFNDGTGNVENVATPAGASATVTITDASVFSTSVLTLSGATPVLKLPAPAVGKRKIVYLVQDATGSRIPSYTVTGGTVKFVGGAAPTLQTAAGKIDRIVFDSIDGVGWIGTPGLNIA